MKAQKMLAWPVPARARRIKNIITQLKRSTSMTKKMYVWPAVARAMSIKSIRINN